jgi:hypothetical protein
MTIYNEVEKLWKEAAEFILPGHIETMKISSQDWPVFQLAPHCHSLKEATTFKHFIHFLNGSGDL